jgi:hypothetical protein
MTDKETLLREFREKAGEYFVEVAQTGFNHKQMASVINQNIIQYRNAHLEKITEEIADDKSRLDAILLTTYVSYVVMLEYRNKVWQYDYMTFSRRIGEIWEPFCKLPFFFPIKELEFYEPPAFDDIQKALNQKIGSYIDQLSVSREEKAELLKYYEEVWMLIDSGSVNLHLDLHFKQNGQFFDVDYKSGFSSNEKGNTNRLLLVASIYSSLPEKHNNLIFVRQKEEENNHYLQTLKNSRYWEVFCADDAYEKIKEFSGFDLKKWMNANMTWVDDIDPGFRKYLQDNALLKYLTW